MAGVFYIYNFFIIVELYDLRVECTICCAEERRVYSREVLCGEVVCCFLSYSTIEDQSRK